MIPTELLRWFDDAPARYWVIAWLAWSALVTVTGLRLVADWAPADRRVKKIPRWLLHPLAFGAVAVLAILAFRWPMVFAGPLEIPDETQLGAGAISLWHDPVPWRSVDLHTSGPVNGYFLWPALLIDGRIDYAGLRLAAIFAHVVTALAGYGLLRRFAPDGVARLAALPLLTFVAFCSHPQFDQYTSEQPSVAFLAVGLWLLGVACTLPSDARRAQCGRLFAAGICLGLIPFAKMQAVALGLTAGGLGVAAAWLHPGGPARERIARVAALVGGALLPAFVVAALLTAYGLWAQFYSAYILANAGYLEGYGDARSAMLWNFNGTFLAYNFEFRAFFLGMMAVAMLVTLLAGLTRLRPRGLVAGAWMLAAAGFWTVIYPGRPFVHYLHFLLVPAGLLGGISLVAALRLVNERAKAARTGRWRWGAALGFVALTLLPQVVTRASFPHAVVGSLVAARHASLHPVSARLRELARPGDTLFVWGWCTRLYTETGLPQGTREGQTARDIEPTPMTRFFRDRTMRDLRKNQPEFIVDSVCPGSFGYVDRRLAGMQIFPELAAYVAENYRLEENLGGYLIYVRKAARTE